MEKKNKENRNKKRELHKADVEFYLSIWKNAKRRCYVTEKYLGNEPLTTYFHHVLPKSRFPEYRYCEWNIILVTPEVHAQIEMNIDMVPTVKELTMELMERHNKGALKSCKNG